MIVWIIAACLAIALVAIIVLWIALRGARSRAGDTDALVVEAQARIRAAVSEWKDSL